MKNFLLGLSKFVLGIILAMLVMSIAGLSMARYFMTRMAEAPERPVYENDLPEAQRPRPAAPSAEDQPAATTSETEAAVADEPEPEPEPEPANTDDGYAAYVTADLNLRSGPGTSYDPIGGLSQDEDVTVIGEENGWMNVILSDGSEGWVSGNYVAE